jgi:hypothetical protein
MELKEATGESRQLDDVQAIKANRGIAVARRRLSRPVAISCVEEKRGDLSFWQFYASGVA